MDDTATRVPDPLDYLDVVTASDPGRAYKQRLLTALDLRPGHAVLDVGCGPGTDLAGLARAVGDAGRVIGIDHDLAMVEAARRRVASYPAVEVRAGDAHELPLGRGGVDRARMDRVLEHLADPGRAIAELRRVVRPGGVVGLAEPDWDTLVVDDVDLDVSRAYTRFVGSRARSQTIGRRLPRLLAEAGLLVRSVDAEAIVFRDFDAADQFLGLRRTVARAIQVGALAEGAAGRWLDRLRGGPFLSCVTFFTATAATRSG